MINILHIVPDLAYGGVEKVVLNYYRFIDRKSYHFDYVSHGTFRSYHTDILDDGSDIFYFDTIGKLGIRKYIQQIRSRVDLCRYDIIHVHTGDITGLYAYAYKRAGAKRIICHSHTAHPVTSKRRIINPLLKFLSCIESDYRIACGKKAGDYCFGHRNYCFLPNAVEVARFQNVSSEQIADLKSELGISNECFIIGHIGTFIPVKNHTFLLDIVDELRNREQDFILLLIGLDTDSYELKRMIASKDLEDHIITCGSRSDVNAIFNLFDLFLLPSLFEGMPVVAVEAQATGVKSIISDTIDQSINLDIGLVSFLPINQGSSIWVDKIIEAMHSNAPRICKEKVEKAFQNSNYSIEKSVGELEHIYYSLSNVE